MNKKLIALAVAGAFVAPVAALADSSSVTIYGTLNMSFENVKADGATVRPGSPGDIKSKNAVTSSSSSLGFKGTEDLGGGLKAWFQLESGIDPSDNTGSGTGLGLRNSGLGLSGDWGTVFLGQWDTPYKMSSYAVTPFNQTTTAGYNAIVGSPGFNVSSGTSGVPADGTSARFDRRQRNSVQYWSPNWSGFSFKGVYAQSESKTVATSPVVWGGSLTYENGPLYVAYAYERHDDFFGLSDIEKRAGASGLPGLSAAGVAPATITQGAGSRDTGNKIQAGYTYMDTKVGVLYERLKYNQNGVVGQTLVDAQRNAWGLFLIQRIGAGAIHAEYLKANSLSCTAVAGACTSNDTGARMYAIGYYHDMSKRTQLYAQFSRVQNDQNASYSWGAGPVNDGAAGGFGTVAAGARPQAFGVGIRHSF